MTQPGIYVPVPPSQDLRNMVRHHLIRRSLENISAAVARRDAAMKNAKTFKKWADSIRTAAGNMLGLNGELDAPLNVKTVSRKEYEHHVLENVIFESIHGWQVNASVFIPRNAAYAPPYPAVVVPIGHSPKTDLPHQIPCQVFARAGFIAVTFDGPGQGGEKCPGNDHFTDGARCYAVGQSSQRYFVADALRAMDYLTSRDDVNVEIGFAMTGVSGGGTTTQWATLLDDRVKASGPVCSAACLIDHPINDQYTVCPEYMPIGRLATGIDDVDVMAAIAPTVQLYMAGRNDPLYRDEYSKNLLEPIRDAYALLGASEQFEFYSEDCGHDYTPSMARHFVGFLEKHWLEQPDRRRAACFADYPSLLPAEEMHCRPATEPNMRTINTARAAMLESSRPALTDPAAVVRAVVPGIDETSTKAIRGSRRPSCQVDIEEVLFQHEQDIELPTTILWPKRDNPPFPAVVVFDDRGRWTTLKSSGWATQAARIYDRNAAESPAVMSVDLRGWGDSAPANSSYDLVGWAAPGRLLNYFAAGLGDGLLSQRVRDAVAACRWLAAQKKIDAERIVLVGRGLGGVVALMAAAAIGNIRGVLCLAAPNSIAEIVGAERFTWPLDIFMPNVLEHLDLNELADALGNVRWVRPCNAEGKTDRPEPNSVIVPWIWHTLEIE